MIALGLAPGPDLGMEKTGQGSTKLAYTLSGEKSTLPPLMHGDRLEVSFQQFALPVWEKSEQSVSLAYSASSLPFSVQACTRQWLHSLHRYSGALGSPLQEAWHVLALWLLMCATIACFGPPRPCIHVGTCTSSASPSGCSPANPPWTPPPAVSSCPGLQADNQASSQTITMRRPGPNSRGYFFSC